MKAEGSGQAANCAPSRKINPFFRPPTNIRLCPIRFVGVPRPLSAWQSVFPRLWGLRRASAIALSVLSCESKAMIFSLLFKLTTSSIINDFQKFICKLDICNFYNTVFFSRVSKNVNATIPNSGFVYDT